MDRLDIHPGRFYAVRQSNQLHSSRQRFAEPTRRVKILAEVGSDFKGFDIDNGDILLVESRHVRYEVVFRDGRGNVVPNGPSYGSPTMKKFQVKEKAFIDLMLEMGLSGAAAWVGNDERLQEKLKCLPELYQEDETFRAKTVAGKKLIRQLLDAVSNGAQVEFQRKGEDEMTTATKTKTKPAASGKGGKGKKTDPKSAGSAKVAGKKVGVIATIIGLLKGASKSKPIDKESILAKLKKEFADRPAESMMKTINTQVPGRIKKDTGLVVQKNEKGYWIN